MTRARKRSNLSSALPYVVLAVLCSGAIAVTTTRGNNDDATSALPGESGTQMLSGSDVTQQLRSIEQRAAELEWETRVERSQEFRNGILEELADLEVAEPQIERLRLWQSEYRRTCAEELRSASKFTKFPVSLRCTQNDLLLEQEFFEEERDRIEALPGVTEDTRALALTRLDLLTDAIQTILTAIESDVFQTVDELKEAKQNLRITYREPFWLLQLRLQAEKLQAWTSSLMTRVALIAEEEQEISTDTVDALLESLTCLQQEENVLEGATTITDPNAMEALIATAQQQMELCIGHLERTQQLQEPPSSQQASSAAGSDEYINRRLQRRLGDEYRIQD